MTQCASQEAPRQAGDGRVCSFEASPHGRQPAGKALRQHGLYAEPGQGDHQQRMANARGSDLSARRAAAWPLTSARSG